MPCPLRVAATAFVLSLVLSGAAGASGHAPRSGGFYSTETPYAPRHGARRHERPPRGFTPVFTQLVARHGSRALTSSHDLEYTKQLIGFARADGGLTELGARLEPEVLELQAASGATRPPAGSSSLSSGRPSSTSSRPPATSSTTRRPVPPCRETRWTRRSRSTKSTASARASSTRW